MTQGQYPMSSAGKVLLTGGTGFIASHVLDCLLEHGFAVVVTVRSKEKGARIVQSIDETSGARKRVWFVVVKNVAADGAFDSVIQSHKFDYVVHTASPYQLDWDDPVQDCLDPAIKGTTGILKSIMAYGPTVKRVVITSSSAAILCPPDHPAVYDESIWSNVTMEQGYDPEHTYRASKKFAELAAWSLTNSTSSPHFSLATINNTYTFGPVPRSLSSLAELNTSNHRLLDLVLGKPLPPTAPVFTFVDVRDVALAHVRAMTVPEAGGNRFYVVGGFFSNPRLTKIVRERFPELGLKVGDWVDDLPEDHWQFSNRQSKEVLGLEYRGLEECVVDAVESILKMVREEGGVETVSEALSERLRVLKSKSRKGSRKRSREGSQGVSEDGEGGVRSGKSLEKKSGRALKKKGLGKNPALQELEEMLKEQEELEKKEEQEEKGKAKERKIT